MAAFTLPSGEDRCASPWFSTLHDHCDRTEFVNGHIWHSAFCDPNYFNGCEASTTETFLVRETGEISPVPEPATFLLLASSLAGAGGMTWRRARRK